MESQQTEKKWLTNKFRNVFERMHNQPMKMKSNSVEYNFDESTKKDKRTVDLIKKNGKAVER